MKCGKEKILFPHHKRQSLIIALGYCHPLVFSRVKSLSAGPAGTEGRRPSGGKTAVQRLRALWPKATAADVFQKPRGNVGPSVPKLPRFLNKKLEIWLLL